MKKCFLLFALCLIGCQPKTTAPTAPTSQVKEISDSKVRVNSTLQSWNIAQPWEKNPARQRRSLAAVVAPNQVLTTTEMNAEATLIEVESTDGAKRARATVACVDYEANLALLKIDDATESADFFSGKSPLAIANNPALGDTVDVGQGEQNGHMFVHERTDSLGRCALDFSSRSIVPNLPRQSVDAIFRLVV